MKLAGAWILLNAVLAQGRLRSLREIDLAMNAAESEVAVHIDAVIKRAKAVDGWDITDVVSKVDVGVSEILDEHGIGGAMKAQAMDHLENKLYKMLEEISEEKELNVMKNEELLEDELEDFLGAKKNDEIMNAEAKSKEMYAAESEVAAHMDAVIERVKSVDGWDIMDVVSQVSAGVNEILDEHGIDGATKEKALDHLDNKLFKMLEEISEEKELNVIENEERIEEELGKDVEAKKNAEAMNAESTDDVGGPGDFLKHEEEMAAASEARAHVNTVIERAKATEGWDKGVVVRELIEDIKAILYSHNIDPALDEKYDFDQLTEALLIMLEEALEEKELNVGNPGDILKDEEAMNAAESEVAAHMDAVIERAKATEGWDIMDVVSKVGVGVNEILDEHGIEGTKKEQVMDHFDNNLSKMLEEISEEKELNVIRNEEQIEEELEEEIEAKNNVEAGDKDMFAAESEVAAEIDALMERVEASEEWDITDEVSKIDVVVTGILEAHGIVSVEKVQALDHLNNKLFKILEKTLAEKKVEINF